MLQISLGFEVLFFGVFILDALVQGHIHFFNLCVIISLVSYSEVYKLALLVPGCALY